MTEDAWRRAVRHRLQAVAWKVIADDVWPFLDAVVDADLLTADNLMRVLS